MHTEKSLLRTKFGSIMLILFFLFPSYAFSWGKTGHRVIGEIATQHLSYKARQSIQEILGDESLAMAANWGDFIKSDTAFKYLNSWHFINIGPNYDYERFIEQLHTDTTANIYNRLYFLSSELKSNSTLSLDKKRQYLKLVIHLLGDIHQPMHVGKPEDLGGNKITVYWFNQPSNLHQLWDEKIIDFQQLSYTEYAAYLNTCTKDEIRQWQSTSVEDWLFESYILAQELYKDVETNNKLGYDYNYKYVESLNKRLLKGGIRLAAVLNEIFS